MAEADDNLRRVPPQNLEAEQSVLGAILIENEAIDRVLEHLKPEDFYRATHREIFAAMIELSNQNKAIDAITLTDLLRAKGKLEAIGGPAYIGDLAAAVPTAASVLHYAKIVRDKATLRALATAASEIASAAYDAPADVPAFVDESEARVQAIAEREIRSDTAITLHDASQAALVEIEKRMTGGLLGLPSGLAEFDYQTGGFGKAELHIIAARPGVGKTALALNMAQAIAATGFGVGFFSLEMSNAQLMLRIVCGEAKLSSLRVRRGEKLTDDELRRLAQAAERLSALPIVLDDDTALTPVRLRAKARRLNRRFNGNLGIIFVDYLQLMQANRKRTGNREEEVAEVSRALKRIAKDLNIPVVGLCQLNRKIEYREGRTPQLADLRESGQIEQDADLVAFVTREEAMNGADVSQAKFWILKQRNGPQAVIDLVYLNTRTRFGSMEKVHAAA